MVAAYSDAVAKDSDSGRCDEFRGGDPPYHRADRRYDRHVDRCTGSRALDGTGREPVPVADLDGAARLVGTVDGAGIVTLAWVELRGSSTAVRSVQFDGAWRVPVDVISDARSTDIAEVGLSLAVAGGVPCLVVSTGSLLDGTRAISTYAFDGSTWIAQATLPGLSSRPGTGQAFASGDQLGVTWTQDPDGEARVAFLDPTSGVWTASTLLETNMSVSTPPLLGISAGRTGTTAALVWGRFEATSGTRTWRYALVSATAVGQTTDLAAGMPNSARPVGVWARETLWIAGSTSSDAVSVWGRGATNVDESVATPGLIVNSVSMALEGDDHLLMGWMSQDPGTTVALNVAQRLHSEWASGPELTGARGGGVVSAARPTLLWQRAVGSAGRGNVVVTSYRDVALGVPGVQKLRVKNGPTVTVRWRPPADPAGITGYVVQVRKGKQPWRTRTTTDAGNPAYTFRATSGATYRVRVAATGEGERGAWSAVKGVTLPKKPKPPRR
ncbi:MAG: fibronectin type III domain-containing protein [Candidatus Nanopelagicales bacterium]